MVGCDKGNTISPVISPVKKLIVPTYQLKKRKFNDIGTIPKQNSALVENVVLQFAFEFKIPHLKTEEKRKRRKKKVKKDKKETHTRIHISKAKETRKEEKKNKHTTNGLDGTLPPSAAFAYSDPSSTLPAHLYNFSLLHKFVMHAMPPKKKL